MACADIIDIEKQDCLNNIGGLEISVSMWQSKDRQKMVFDKSTWKYTDIEFSDGATPAELIKPVSIGFHKKTANLTQSMEGDIATANSTNVATLSLTINNQDFDKSRAISIMASGQRELDIALAYNNGKKWFLPNVVLKTTESNSGTEKTDGSNYVLTFEGEYEALVGGLENTLFDALISTGSTETGGE